MSFHGGFLGTVAAMVLFAWRRGIPLWSLFDVIAPSVCFGLFLGRVANFVNGELWGRVTDLPWAVIFPSADGAPRHPSQLYEAALEGVVLLLALRLLIGQGRLATPGFIAGAFAFGYGLSRTFVEFFREPDVQIGFLAGGLTMGMLLSLPMAAFGLYVMIRIARRPQSADEAARRA
jgi:phosphatidylglycerol:prolipoprotein diacylglycerol transferase